MWAPKVKGIPEAPEKDKTTLVMLGHSRRRFKNLNTIIPKYVNYSSVLDKIVFIWNNPKEKPPEMLEGLVTIEIYHRNNSLNNRYDVSAYNIGTKTVLTVDDDIWLEETLIRDMITRHNIEGERLVGLEIRNARNGTYNFGYKHPRLIIGQTMMWNRYFGVWYTNNLFIQQSNDNPDYFGCDDIAMNALIQFKTGEDAVAVRKRGRLHELSFIGGVSLQRKWLKKRSKCVKYYGEHYNLEKWFQ